MSATTSLQDHSAKVDFDARLRDLTSAWWSHQQLKTARAPLADLATSNANLFRARVAMGCWRRQTRS